MDWCLVLASQGIETTLARPEPENHWILMVASGDAERALDSIRRYRLENRRWSRRLLAQAGDVSFHAGALLWAWALLFWYWVAYANLGRLESIGAMNNVALQTGEWWRLVTATTLHADLGHLAANLATGTILLGLCLPIYGAGASLFLGLLAGATGNLLAAWLRLSNWHGLGASGVVLSWLGLLAASAFCDQLRPGHLDRRRFVPLVAGILLFILLGLNPQADVLVHTGGFGTGLVLGVLQTLLVAKAGNNQWIGRVQATLSALLLGAAWLAASQSH